MAFHNVVIFDQSAEQRKKCIDLLGSYTEHGKPVFFSQEADSLDSLQEIFKTATPDLVIIDAEYNKLLNNQVYEFVRYQAKIERYVGVIFTLQSSYFHDQTDILALNSENFIKNTNFSDELVPRIKSTLKLKKNIDSLSQANTKLINANEKLEKITITDDLSGLFNMRYFKKRFEQEFVRSDRYDKFLSVIMFDIDNFKKVNDTTDHLMGSYILAEIGKIITSTIRTVDIGARFGGDEYVILLPETGPEGARNVAQRISDLIKNNVFDNGHSQYRVTISCGVASMGPGLIGFENSTDFLRLADSLLYDAKDAGKNTVKSS